MFLNPKNSDVNTQIKTLLKILELNTTFQKVADAAEKAIKYPWYIAGGGIYHTIWNYFSNKPLEEDVKDYDIFYFAPNIKPEEQQLLKNKLNSNFTKPIVDLSKERSQ